LIDIKFSHLTRNMTMQRTLKLYKLPENTKVSGFRKLVYTDIPQAHKILTEVCIKAKIVDIYFISSMYCY
jgi:glycylpeptide N-tetradecanoyltransferase